MGQIDNLAQGDFAEVWRAIRALQFATNQNNMAIGRGGLSVYDGGMITIENGGLRVTGSAEVIGSLIASGTIDFTGTVTISGPLTISGDTDITGEVTVTGPTHLNGTTDIAGDSTVTGDLNVDGPMKTTGTLSVEGVTTLKNDLNVTTGGKIVAGNVTIDPTSNSGSLTFAGAGSVWAAPGIVQVASGTGSALAVSGGATSIRSGTGNEVSVSDGVYLLGLPTTSNPANLYIDPSTKKVYRSTA